MSVSKFKDRFPRIVLTSEYSITNDSIITPEDSLCNIYDVLLPVDSKRFLIPSGKHRNYFSSNQDPEIIIALLVNNSNINGLNKGFLPSFRESTLADRSKIYEMRDILPSWRRIPLNEKSQLRYQTLNYVKNTLRDILGKTLVTKKLIFKSSNQKHF